jgi:hypothetical protein
VVNPGAGALEPVASYVDIGRRTGRLAGNRLSQEWGELRSLGPRVGPVTGARSVAAARVIDIVRSVGVVVVAITVSLAHPGPTTDGPRGTAIAVTLGVCVAAWVVWILAGDPDRLMAGSLIVMGGAGGVLTGLSPNSPAVAVGCVAVFSAGARLSTMASLGVTAETLAGFLTTGLVTGIPTVELLGYAWAFVGLWTVALTRNEFLVRAVSAERALYVSEATVKTHVNRIFAKTGSRDRSQAIRYAYTHGYADPARS